jgi:hypothetical protein
VPSDAEAALSAVKARAAGEVSRERLTVTLNKVYRADTAGYVSAYCDGGYNDRVQLLVGPEDPPAT